MTKFFYLYKITIIMIVVLIIGSSSSSDKRSKTSLSFIMSEQSEQLGKELDKLRPRMIIEEPVSKNFFYNDINNK